MVRGGLASHPYAITPGILMMGPGLVTHCVITNNSGTSAMESSWAKTALANAVVMKGTGGRLENCLIRDNRSGVEGGTGSDKTSTVYATGTATLSNCTIMEGPYESVTSVQAESNGLLKLSIPAPSSIPARFVRIGASESPVTGGTEL